MLYYWSVVEVNVSIGQVRIDYVHVLDFFLELTESNLTMRGNI